MESRRQEFRDRLAVELGARFESLRAENGGRGVLPPSDELLDAFVEALAPTWRVGATAVMAKSITRAADAYEHLVGRWPDPAWRVLVSIALEVGVRRPAAPTTPEREVTMRPQRHRSAGSFSRDLTLGGAGLQVSG